MKIKLLRSLIKLLIVSSYLLPLFSEAQITNDTLVVAGRNVPVINYKKTDWFGVPYDKYRFNIHHGLGMGSYIFPLGIRYQIHNFISFELNYDYYSKPTYVLATNSYNGPNEIDQTFIGAINVHIKPSIFILSFIYRDYIRSGHTKFGERRDVYIPAIGIMTNNRINGYFRIGFIGFNLKEVNTGSNLLNIYADLGVGYNFDLKGKRNRIQ